MYDRAGLGAAVADRPAQATATPPRLSDSVARLPGGHGRHYRPAMVVLVPAFNESATIGNTLDSIFAQTVTVDEVYVLADHCTDDTVEVAKRYPVTDIIEVDLEQNPHKKAGILNIAMLERPGLLFGEHDVDLHNDDYVLSVDADTVLVPEFLERCIATVETDYRVGSVCASYRGWPGRPGLIHLLQRNEYDRFARLMERRSARAWILSGVCQFYKAGTLRAVYWGRKDCEIPGNPGEIWDSVAATEDIEITMAIRDLGYHLKAPRDCVVYTDTMPTWAKLASQRKRWQRGMLDSLRAYGIKWMTAEYIFRQIGLYLGCIGVPLYVIALTLTYLLGGHLVYHPWWLLLTGLFVFERTITVRKCGWKAMLLAAPLVFEFAYEIFRSFVYWGALLAWLFNRERHWELT